MADPDPSLAMTSDARISALEARMTEAERLLANALSTIAALGSLPLRVGSAEGRIEDLTPVAVDTA